MIEDICEEDVIEEDTPKMGIVEDHMRGSDSFKSYMHEIGQYPLLSRDEERAAGLVIQQGPNHPQYEIERDRLIKSNLRLVVKIAHDYKGFGIRLQDLVAEGNLGLMVSAEKFNPDKGAKFSSYAAWGIKQSIRRAFIEQKKLVRIPLSSLSKICKIKKLAELLGENATDYEIATGLDLSERVVARLRHINIQKEVSLSQPLVTGENGTIENMIPSDGGLPSEVTISQEETTRIRHLMYVLDERERMIVYYKAGLDGGRPKTLEEISHFIGRTRERVRQIHKKAVRKLRILMQAEDAGEFNSDDLPLLDDTSYPKIPDSLDSKWKKELPDNEVCLLINELNRCNGSYTEVRKRTGHAYTTIKKYHQMYIKGELKVKGLCLPKERQAVA